VPVISGAAVGVVDCSGVGEGESVTLADGGGEASPLSPKQPPANANTPSSAATPIQ
jgi:hypothetical protein